LSRQPYYRLLLSVLSVCLCLSGSLLGQKNSISPPAALSTVAVVLDRHGCEPHELVFPAGNNLLEVLNRTGFDAITYHIRPANPGTATAGSSLLDFTLQGRASSAFHNLKFSPGSYKMTLDNGARWTCPITVK